jgi:hypothetical protein
MNKNTHAQRLVSFMQIKQGRNNEITSSQKSKVATSKPNPLHFSQWHQVPKRKSLSSINTHLIGIERWDKVNQENPKEDKKDKGSQINYFARNKANRSKSQGEDDPQNLPHKRIHFVKDKNYIGIISRWYIA